MDENHVWVGGHRAPNVARDGRDERRYGQDNERSRVSMNHDLKSNAAYRPAQSIQQTMPKLSQASEIVTAAD